MNRSDLDDLLNSSDSDDEDVGQSVPIKDLDLEKLLAEDEDDENDDELINSLIKPKTGANVSSKEKQPVYKKHIPEAKPILRSVPATNQNSSSVVDNSLIIDASEALPPVSDRISSIDTPSNLELATNDDLKSTIQTFKRFVRGGKRDTVSALRAKLQSGSSSLDSKSSALNAAIRVTTMRRISEVIFPTGSQTSHRGSKGPGRSLSLCSNDRFISIGTSRGLILVFDHFESIQQILGSSGDQAGIPFFKSAASSNSYSASESSPVLSIDMSADGDKLVAGYGNGVIIVWDIMRGSQLKSLNDIYQAPIRFVRFSSEKLANDEFMIISADEQGLIFRLFLSKIRLLGAYAVDSTCLVNKTAGTIIDMVARKHTSLSGGNTNQNAIQLNEFCRRDLVAISSAKCTFVIEVRPKIQILFKWPMQSSVIDALYVTVSTSWIESSCVVTDQATGFVSTYAMPALLRLCNIESTCVVELLCGSFADDGKSDTEAIVFVPGRTVNITGGFFAIVPLLTSHSIIALQSTGIVGLDHEMAPISTISFEQPMLWSNQPGQPPSSTMPCLCASNMISVSSKSMLVLSDNAGVVHIQSQSIFDRLNYLSKNNMWLDALALAVSYGHVIMSQSPGQESQGTVIVTDSERSRIRDVEVQLLREYVKILDQVEPQSRNQPPRHPGRLDSNRHDTIARVAVDFAVETDLSAMLFSELYEKFKSKNSHYSILGALEPHVLSGKLKTIPAAVLHDLIEFMQKENKIEDFGRMTLYLDVSEHEVSSMLIGVLARKHVYAPMIHVCIVSDSDNYVTPISLLCLRLQENIRRHNNDEAKSIARLVLAFVHQTIMGFIFPTREILAEGTQSRAMDQIITFLAGPSASMAVSNEVATSPTTSHKEFSGLPSDLRNIHLLALVDCESMLAVVRLAFKLEESLDRGSADERESHYREISVSDDSPRESLESLKSHKQQLVNPGLVSMLLDQILSFALWSSRFRESSWDLVQGFILASRSLNDASKNSNKIFTLLPQEVFSKELVSLSAEFCRCTGGFLSPAIADLAASLYCGESQSADSIDALMYVRSGLRYSKTTGQRLTGQNQRYLLLEEEFSQVQEDLIQILKACFLNVQPDSANQAAPGRLERLAGCLQSRDYWQASFLLYSRCFQMSIRQASLITVVIDGEQLDLKHHAIIQSLNKAILCFTNDNDKTFKIGVFEYLKQCLSMIQDFRVVSRSTSSAAKNPVTFEQALWSATKSLVLSLVDKFARIDEENTRNLISEYLLDDPISTLECLKQVPHLQLYVLDAMTSGQHFSGLQVDGEVDGSLRSQIKSDVVMYHVRLLADSQPERVLGFLMSKEGYPLDDCLELCSRLKIRDAECYLIDRTGDTSKAISVASAEIVGLALSGRPPPAVVSLRLIALAKMLDPVLSSQSASKMSQPALQQQQIQLLSNVFSDPCMGEQIPLTEAELLQLKRGKRLIHMCQVAIGICSRNSSRTLQVFGRAKGKSEKVASMWFQLLDVLMDTKDLAFKVLSSWQSRARSMNLVMTRLINMTLGSMSLFVAPKDVVMKIMEDHTKCKLSDFPGVFQSMIHAYSFELDMLASASLSVREGIAELLALKRNLQCRGINLTKIACLFDKSEQLDESKLLTTVGEAFQCEDMSLVICLEKSQSVIFDAKEDLKLSEELSSGSKEVPTNASSIAKSAASRISDFKDAMTVRKTSSSVVSSPHKSIDYSKAVLVGILGSARIIDISRRASVGLLLELNEERWGSQTTEINKYMSLVSSPGHSDRKMHDILAKCKLVHVTRKEGTESDLEALSPIQALQAVCVIKDNLSSKKISCRLKINVGIMDSASSNDIRSSKISSLTAINSSRKRSFDRCKASTKSNSTNTTQGVKLGGPVVDCRPAILPLRAVDPDATPRAKSFADLVAVKQIQLALHPSHTRQPAEAKNVDVMGLSGSAAAGVMSRLTKAIR